LKTTIITKTIIETKRYLRIPDVFDRLTSAKVLFKNSSNEKSKSLKIPINALNPGQTGQKSWDNCNFI
jgi:hypothetical protein